MASDVEILFRGVPEPDRAALLALGEFLPFAAGEIVLPAGRSEWDTYIIEEGEIGLWIGNACLAELGPGQTIGTSAILCSHLQRSAAKGKTDGRLRRIRREALTTFFEGRPQRLYQLFCINVFRVWVEVLNHRNARIAEIQRQIFALSLAGGRERRYRLLVADDEPVTRSELERFFAPQYEVVTAEDGAAAIEQAILTRPHLALLGLHLPAVDGFVACQRLKAHPRTASLPVIMLSSSDAVPEKVKSMMCGAEGYFVKPLDLQELGSTVKALLDRKYGD